MAPPYVIDTSIWIHIGRHHPPDIFRSVWQSHEAASARLERIRTETESTKDQCHVRPVAEAARTKGYNDRHQRQARQVQFSDYTG